MEWITEINIKDFKNDDWIVFKAKNCKMPELGVVEVSGSLKYIYLPLNDESETLENIEKYLILPKL